MRPSKNELIALSRLLDEALELPAEARDAWLEKIAAPLDRLRPKLRVMLMRQARVETEDFLGTLPKLTVAEGAENAAVGNGFRAGQLVGVYALVREIGRGGMSAVWLANRTDGLTHRSVALKLSNQHLFIDQARLAERFARERDILAALTHPNIARLYDAGVSAEGQPYLAMEYVEGESFIKYCDSHRLTVRERLVIFLQILSAVQYAHAHLVIHRDLKPSNILVTAGGHVQLLDFGIAKLLANGEAKETALTQVGGRALTPQYAAPEQIAGASVTTAADVYSLSVMLCEVLSGAPPYRLKRDSAAVLEDAILNAEAASPSRLVTESAALARGTSARRLRRHLGRDLDTIVLRGLKKLPAQRYGTVEALRLDIQNHLSGRPILAHSDSLWYRIQKALWRNKLLAGATAAVCIALFAGVAVALWQAQRAHAHALIAEREAHKAATVQAFLLDLFTTNTDQQQDPLAARTTTVRELLDRGASKIDSALTSEPEVRAAVLDSLAEMYTAVGLDEQSASLKYQRIEVLRHLWGANDPRLAEPLLTYAQDVEILGDPQRALNLAREAGKMLDAANDFSSSNRALWLMDTARFETRVAPVLARQTTDSAVEFYRNHNPTDEDLATAMSYAGRTRIWLGEYADAELSYLAALAEVRAHGRNVLFQEFITDTLGLADAQFALGKVADAEQQLRSALAASIEHNGPLHVDTVHAQTRLGSLLHLTARRTEGRALLLGAAAKLREHNYLNVPNLASPVHRGLGLAMLADGLWEEADKEFGAALELKRREGVPTLALARALDDQAAAATLLGRYAVAETLVHQALETWRTVVGVSAYAATANRYVLSEATLKLAMGNAQGAIGRYAQIVATKDEQRLPLRMEDELARMGTAAAYLQLNQNADAYRVAKAVVRDIQDSPLRDYYPTLEADALLRFGEAQRRAGELDAAQSTLEKALNLRRVNGDINSPWIAEVEIAIANCLLDMKLLRQARLFAASAQRRQQVHRELGEQFQRPLRELKDRLALVAHTQS